MVETPQVRGKKFELKVLKLLKDWGYKKLGRTILLDKQADNSGVDIKARTEGKTPLNIQCKSSSKQVKYDVLLHNFPKDGATNIILHEKWFKGESRGTYAILTAEQFFELVNR